MSDNSVQSLPSYNPADASSVAGGFRIFQNNLMKLIENAIPCIVQNYDAKKNIVTVNPAINVATTTGEYVQRGVIKITAWRFASAGFVMHYPIKKGDTGWIIGSDYDTSLFKQTKTISDPNTYLKHKYHFGFYFPDSIDGFNVSEDDDGRLVFQNTSGTEKISIGPNDTKILSANLSINATSLTVMGETQFNGNVNISGDMHSANYDTHTHGGVTGGSSNTGVPNG